MAEKQHGGRENPTRGVPRDEQAGLSDQERTLQDNIVGQKTTPDGTAGKDGEHAPTGDAAREKTTQREG